MQDSALDSLIEDLMGSRDRVNRPIAPLAAHSVSAASLTPDEAIYLTPLPSDRQVSPRGHPSAPTRRRRSPQDLQSPAGMAGGHPGPPPA
jgi:hypothetical protein